MKEVRTRFAPSPTGYLHVGGIRTALFAYLVARQAGGKFILRFEDTDKKREVPGSAEHLIASLKAIGIEYDEGPDIGGPYGPYIQSQRLDSYKIWAQKLIDSGRAYADPYSAEQINEFREKATAEKRAFRYRDHRPENPPAWDGTMPLRFKSEPKSYTYHDEVMGDFTTSPEVVEDFVLIKSDGYPTYNFAHIIDDAEMKVTHVVRGQEFISSMPNYLALYEALGLDRPIFAHLPHILNEQGNKKLGKRDGAKDVLDYIRDGYLSEALMSFIATMGWNDGTEQETFTKQELIEKFSLSRVQKSGARFDEKRLLWVNGYFTRKLSLDDLYDLCSDFWPESASDYDSSYKKTVLSLVQDRLKTLSDLAMMTDYFFTEPEVKIETIKNDKKLSTYENQRLVELLTVASESFKDSDFSKEDLQVRLNSLLEQTDEKPASLFSLIRISISFAPFSPALNETLHVIGKERSLNRLNKTIKALAN